MDTKVVDASAVAAFCFGESEQGVVFNDLHGCKLLAPNLLPFELANTALQKIRKSPSEETAILAGFKVYESLDIVLEEIPPLEGIETAKRTGLTAYDASYVVLAKLKKLRLVTLDLKQKSAILI